MWLCPLFAREYILMSFDTLQPYRLSLKQPTLIPDCLGHDCFHIHVMTSTWKVLLFSFLRLFGLFYPLSACIPAETQSHVQA